MGLNAASSVCGRPLWVVNRRWSLDKLRGTPHRSIGDTRPSSQSFSARTKRQLGDKSQMDSETDEMFYRRADAHIDLANEQVADASRGKVSASFMYAVARFNSWVSACRARFG
jgi:hypothetical protein